MAEICPKCGNTRVAQPRTALEGRIRTIYYRCDGCGHEWHEKRLREKRSLLEAVQE